MNLTLNKMRVVTKQLVFTFIPRPSCMVDQINSVSDLILNLDLVQTTIKDRQYDNGITWSDDRVKTFLNKKLTDSGKGVKNISLEKLYSDVDGNLFTVSPV